jgi:hypothetical protein
VGGDGLVCPEIVLFTAYSQYSEARWLINFLNMIKPISLRNAKQEENTKQDPTDQNQADSKAPITERISNFEVMDNDAIIVASRDNIQAHQKIEKASIHQHSNTSDDIKVVNASVPNDSDHPRMEEAKNMKVQVSRRTDEYWR